MNRLTVISAAAVFSLLASMAWAIHHYRATAITYKAQRDKATERLRLADATISDMQTRQRDIALLDAQYTKALTHAKAENDALQRRLDNGGRVRVRGKCPVSSVPATARASGLDDGSPLELSDTAGRNVLAIRGGIQRDQIALKGLQKYITTQCINRR